MKEVRRACMVQTSQLMYVRVITFILDRVTHQLNGSEKRMFISQILLRRDLNVDQNKMEDKVKNRIDVYIKCIEDSFR